MEILLIGWYLLVSIIVGTYAKGTSIGVIGGILSSVICTPLLGILIIIAVKIK